VPGWHARTRQFAADGKLLNVGILEEQHPDRARLFLQWQGIDWTILVDAFNKLDVNVVPITLLIDENGVIRHRVGGRDDFAAAVESFLAEPPIAPPVAEADPEPALDDRIGRGQFELGVLYRMRYDEHGDPADFANAIEAWGRAVEADPNQYIWRRRIQQYGPRLEKPYPFYDWVPAARAEIEARGEEPVALRVEPEGAEIAMPARRFDAAAPTEGEPDPGGKVHRDAGELVQVHSTVVPHRVAPGKSARVHLEFRPASEHAHWNNEAGGMTLWVEAPDGWKIDRARLERENPPHPVSDETRRFEFEVQLPAGATGAVRLPAYALYYVCRSDAGACLYRRQDVPVVVDVVDVAP